jgi:hypothetical protein
MFTRRSIGLALAATVVCGAAWAALPQGTCTLRRGVGQGMWALPLSSSGTGSLDGILYTSGPSFAYHFTATLTDEPTPCLSCIEGSIHGTLDDGIGVGPDYLVHGHYDGAFLSGQGTFTAKIFPATGPAVSPVGRMRGVFDDPPGNTTPGTFKCRWAICD